MNGYSFSVLPPLSLYIHIPWCVRKCPYCDFNSHAVKGELPEAAYVDALLRDLELDLPRVWGRTVESIFIGGGTPSLFSPAAIDRLLAGIRSRLPLKPGLEITLEANPGTVEQQKFEGFRAAGINRLSIGVQSLDDEKLHALGRIHSADEARSAVKAARGAGFDNINLDLMSGLPQQTVTQALDDLQQTLALEPEHLSWYQLTLEPNTLFHSAPPPLPDDDLKWDMQSRGHALLEASGYTQYEVSAWAKPGRECRHNLNYWRFGDYLGIGAGAHGKISDAAAQAVFRTRRRRHPQDFLAAAGTMDALDGDTPVAENDAVFEFVLNKLRLREGFSLADFSTATGLPAGLIAPIIEQAVHDGLLQNDGGRILHTERGWRFLDDLVAYFLPGAAADA